MAQFYQSYRKPEVKDTYLAPDIWEISIDIEDLSLSQQYLDGSENRSISFETMNDLVNAYKTSVTEKINAGYRYVNSFPENLNEVIDFTKLGADKKKNIKYLGLSELMSLYKGLPFDLIKFIEEKKHVSYHGKSAKKICSSFSVAVHFLSPRALKELKSKDVKQVIKDMETPVDISRLVPFVQAKSRLNNPWTYEGFVYIHLKDGNNYELLILDTDGRYFEPISASTIDEFMKLNFEQ